MKLCAITICYNSDDYLDYVIRSALGWVDNMVVVEGAFQITIDAGAPAHSTDKTLNIIDQYSYDKKFYGYSTKTPCREHKDQYDLALQLAKEKFNPDWVILIDSDEVYNSTTLRAIKKILNVAPNSIMGGRIHSYNFINDFKHFYEGLYPRIFRATPSSVFTYDNKVCWPEEGFDGDNMEMPAPKHIMTVSPDFRFFHYAYVKDHNYLDLKAKYMYNKDGNKAYDPDNPKYRVENGIYKIPDNIPIKEFRGLHPVIMREHPYYKKGE